MKTFFREDADPTEDCEPALNMVALECAVVRHKGGVVPLPFHLLDLFDDYLDEWDDDWETRVYVEDSWFWWCDDPDATLEEIWEAAFMDAPETFLGGHSGMSRTNLSRRSRAA